MPISTDRMKQVLSRWASGITVVTTRRENGIHGMTASSFCSVSLDPPLVLISVNKKNRTHTQIADQKAFGVHILAEDQEELSSLCAGFQGEAGNWLEGMRHHPEHTGAPILDDCSTWLDCSLWATYDAGDHTLYVGQVEAGSAGDEQPLLWFDRGYRRLRR